MKNGLLRIRALSELIRRSSEGLNTPILADVGCDHGYLGIMLVNSNTVDSCIATDINEGPLRRAKENIAAAHLQDRIDTRLSDGLDGIAPGEVNIIAMAGMGGLLMKSILERGEDVCRRASELVLQPQSDIETFRRFLSDFGLHIVDEDFIIESNKYYPMMRCRWAKDGGEDKSGSVLPDEIVMRYGSVLIEDGNINLALFLNEEYRVLSRLLDDLSLSAMSDKTRDKIATLGNDIRINRDAAELLNIKRGGQL